MPRVLFSGSVIARVGEGLRGVLANGEPNPKSTSSPAFGIAFLRVFGERKNGSGESGVRGEGNGDVACEEDVDVVGLYIDLDDEERESGFNLNKFVTLGRLELCWD